MQKSRVYSIDEVRDKSECLEVIEIVDDDDDVVDDDANKIESRTRIENIEEYRAREAHQSPSGNETGEKRETYFGTSRPEPEIVYLHPRGSADNELMSMVLSQAKAYSESLQNKADILGLESSSQLCRACSGCSSIDDNGDCISHVCKECENQENTSRLICSNCKIQVSDKEKRVAEDGSVLCFPCRRYWLQTNRSRPECFWKPYVIIKKSLR